MYSWFTTWTSGVSFEIEKRMRFLQVSIYEATASMNRQKITFECLFKLLAWVWWQVPKNLQITEFHSEKFHNFPFFYFQYHEINYRKKGKKRWNVKATFLRQKRILVFYVYREICFLCVKFSAETEQIKKLDTAELIIVKVNNFVARSTS